MQPSCRGPPQPPPASWSPGEDYVSSAPSITSCIAVSFAEGALSLLPVLIKKLYAQEVSLFCVFKTGAGVAYGVICFFRPGAPSRNLLLFFKMRRAGGPSTTGGDQAGSHRSSVCKLTGLA